MRKRCRWLDWDIRDGGRPGGSLGSELLAHDSEVNRDCDNGYIKTFYVVTTYNKTRNNKTLLSFIDIKKVSLLSYFRYKKL